VVTKEYKWNVGLSQAKNEDRIISTLMSMHIVTCGNLFCSSVSSHHHHELRDRVYGLFPASGILNK
jgi:hypothetical protein